MLARTDVRWRLLVTLGAFGSLALAACLLAPLVGSETVVDCFELARDIRTLDMRASPYDLAELGYEPVRIETPEGRAAYAVAQKGFAERAAPLRARLLTIADRALLAAATVPA